MDDSDSGSKETAKEERHEGLPNNVTTAHDHDVFTKSGDVVRSYQLDDPEGCAWDDERMRRYNLSISFDGKVEMRDGRVCILKEHRH